MKTKEIFIHNLKFYRKERGVSQMRLAELCNSSTGYIGQIEIGNKFPSIEMIDKICAALAIKPYMLFADGGENDTPPPIRPPKRYTMPEAVKTALVEQLNAAVRRVVKRQ